MFYRYEHYMSISHMALIGAVVYHTKFIKVCVCVGGGVLRI